MQIRSVLSVLTIFLQISAWGDALARAERPSVALTIALSRRATSDAFQRPAIIRGVLDKGTTCALRVLTTSSRFCRQLAAPFAKTMPVQQSYYGYLARSSHRHVLCAPLVVHAQKENETIDSSISSRAVRDVSIGGLFGLKVDTTTASSAVQDMSGSLAHPARKEELLKVANLLGHAKLHWVRYMLHHRSRGNASDPTTGRLAAIVQSLAPTFARFPRLAAEHVQQQGEISGRQQPVVNRYDSLKLAVRGKNQSGRTAKSSGSGVVQQVAPHQNSSKTPYVHSILVNPVLMSPTAVDPQWQVGVVGFGGVRDAILVGWLRGSDSPIEGLRSGHVTSAGALARGNSSSNGPVSASGLDVKGLNVIDSCVKQFLHFRSQARLWAEQGRDPSDAIDEKCAKLGFRALVNALDGARMGGGSRLREQREQPGGLHITKMLNSMSNMEGAKHSMLPSVMTAIAATRAVYAAADPVLALQSLTSRTTGALLQRSNDSDLHASGPQATSTQLLIKTFLDGQVHGSNLGLLECGLQEEIAGLAAAVPPDDSLDPGAQVGAAARVSKLGDRLDRVTEMLTADRQEACRQYRRRNRLVRSSNGGTRHNHVDLPSTSLELSIRRDVIGFARHAAAYAGSRHSFDLLWTNMDAVPDWPVRAAAHAFAGTTPKSHPFPPFRQRKSIPGGKNDLKLRRSAGMADALGIVSGLPSVALIPWKWSRFVAGAAMLDDHWSGGGEPPMYRSSGESKVDTTVPIGWYDAPWLVDRVRAAVKKQARAAHGAGLSLLSSCMAAAALQSSDGAPSLTATALQQAEKQRCLLKKVHESDLSQDFRAGLIASGYPASDFAKLRVVDLLAAAVQLAAVPADALVVAEAARRLDEEVCPAAAAERLQEEGALPERAANQGASSPLTSVSWRPDRDSPVREIAMHLAGSKKERVSRYETRSAAAVRARNASAVLLSHAMESATNSLVVATSEAVGRKRSAAILPSVVRQGGSICKAALWEAACMAGNLKVPGQLLESGVVAPLGPRVRLRGTTGDRIKYAMGDYMWGLEVEGIEYAGERWGPAASEGVAMIREASRPLDDWREAARMGRQMSCLGIAVEEAAGWADWD